MQKGVSINVSADDCQQCILAIPWYPYRSPSKSAPLKKSVAACWDPSIVVALGEMGYRIEPTVHFH